MVRGEEEEEEGREGVRYRRLSSWRRMRLRMFFLGVLYVCVCGWMGGWM